MSDAPEAPEVDFGEIPKPKKKATRKGKRRAKAAPESKSTVPFPGLTRNACADACNADGCAISGKSYCAHPTKGGLHSGDMNDTAALKRLQKARDQLQVRIDPDRFK